jgi:thymidine kinase
MGPREVKYKRAVCEVCKSPDAIHTQVYHKEKPLTGGAPSIIPEDGTYMYLAVCRKCFVSA